MIRKCEADESEGSDRHPQKEMELRNAIEQISKFVHSVLLKILAERQS
jgi:hypothetical protein